MCGLSKVFREIKTPRKIIQTKMLGKARIKESLQVLHSGFFKQENICCANGVPDNPKACDELAKLAEITAQDGFSMIATEKDTNKIIGTFYNKLITPQCNFFENFYNNCQQPNSKAVLKLILDVGSLYDIRKMFNVDCYIDMMFISVLPEYGNYGIGRIFVEDFLTHLATMEKDAKPRIEVVACLLTSIYTHLVATKLNFTHILRKEFSDFKLNDKQKYSDVVDCKLHTQGLTVMAKELKQWKIERNIR